MIQAKVRISKIVRSLCSGAEASDPEEVEGAPPGGAEAAEAAEPEETGDGSAEGSLVVCDPKPVLGL